MDAWTVDVRFRHHDAVHEDRRAARAGRCFKGKKHEARGFEYKVQGTQASASIRAARFNSQRYNEQRPTH
jgi:hypothetical protein